MVTSKSGKYHPKRTPVRRAMAPAYRWPYLHSACVRHAKSSMVWSRMRIPRLRAMGPGHLLRLICRASLDTGRLPTYACSTVLQKHSRPPPLVHKGESWIRRSACPRQVKFFYPCLHRHRAPSLAGQTGTASLMSLDAFVSCLVTETLSLLTQWDSDSQQPLYGI